MLTHTCKYLKQGSSEAIDFLGIIKALSYERVLKTFGVLDTFKEDGNKHFGTCPICRCVSTFAFRNQTGRWYCNGNCGEGGNLLDLIARKERTGVVEAAKLAVQWFNLDKKLLGEKGSAPSESRRNLIARRFRARGI